MPRDVMYPEDVRGEGPRRRVEHQFRISVVWVKGRFLGDGWMHEESGGQECASGFIVLGEIAGALDGELTNYLPIMTSHLRDANRLLKCISAILSRSHHSMPRQSASVSRGHITTVTPQVQELSGSALVQFSLRTLAHFNFKGYDLLVFARESVYVYLENEDGATRKDAALCCCKLV
ncbi:hypothetical protein CQW23_31736 [Capsicum baccatum]|uniref:Uncharacterized protein n=1 Tax=Capsicum baccatum TaxID=33114 RepID=A0A2G2V6R1_CAPBA|nr:hypothetical protein CQW23_31736 [Capsicum baccatum]